MHFKTVTYSRSRSLQNGHTEVVGCTIEIEHPPKNIHLGAPEDEDVAIQRARQWVEEQFAASTEPTK